MPLDPNLGGNNKGREINKGDNIGKVYLTMKQAVYIYRKVEVGSLINYERRNRSRCRIRQMDNTSGDENPYRGLIVNR